MARLDELRANLIEDILGALNPSLDADQSRAKAIYARGAVALIDQLKGEMEP